MMLSHKRLLINVFHAKDINISNCRKYIAKNCEIVLQNSGSRETAIHNTSTEGSKRITAMYLRYLIEVLRKQISVIEKV